VERGGIYRIDHQWWPALRKACKASGVVLPAGMRPMHDLGRVTSITNGVRANEHGSKLQARARHASFATTQRYIDLAGVAFHEEAQALEERMLQSSTASASSTDWHHLSRLRMMLHRLRARCLPDNTASK
jgi:hypothetical protein